MTIGKRQYRTRLYGLFEAKGNGQWVRLAPALALPKEQAVRLFQDALLGPLFAGTAIRELKVVGTQFR